MKITTCFAIAVVLALFLALSEAAGELPVFGDLCRDLAGEDGNVRRQAAQLLGRSGNPAAVEALVTAYRREAGDSAGVKAECAGALGALGTPEAVAALEEMLGDSDYWVRKRVTESLGSIPGEKSKQVLKKALGDNDPRVRATALISAGILKERPEIFLAGMKDPDSRIASAALEGLFRSGAPEAASALSAAMGSSDASMRFRAASLGVAAGNPQASEILRAGMRAEPTGAQAVREAARAGCPSVPLLATCGTDETCSSKDQAFSAIEKQADCPASTEFLVEIAGGSGYSPQRRVRAASALFDRRQALTEPQISRAAKLLDESDPDLVAVSLQILLERGGPPRIAKVVPMVRHENVVVRHFAIATLAKFGSRDDETVLTNALKDANGANIRAALEGLSRLGTRASIPAVKSLLEDRLLRRYAQETLDAIEAR